MARQQPRRLGAGIERSVGIAERPDLRELIRERQGLRYDQHGGELRIFRCPVVDLAFRELGDLPGLAAVVGAPHAGAEEVAAAARPQSSGDRVADDVVDRPAVAERPLDRPASRSRPPNTKNAPLVVPTSSVVRVADIGFLLSIESNSGQ